MQGRSICRLKRLPLIILFLYSLCVNAQTEMDGIMMTKNNFCTGVIGSYNSWKDYWEGTNKRNNENLGTVSTNMTGLMGNYGISDKLNAIFSLAYVQTKASAGTLKGMKGLQDLSLNLKWMPVDIKFGKGVFSLYGVAGFSLPAWKIFCYGIRNVCPPKQYKN